MLEIKYFGIVLENKKLLITNKIEIGNGRLMLLFGNNECGKSLFLRSIHGDFTNYEGEILIKEKTPLFYKKRKRTLLIENESQVLPSETVWKNIILPLPKITKRTKQKVLDLFKVVELENIRDRKVKNISYSQKKFLEIIRAVIQLPYLILIDDIDNYFDSKNMIKALKILEYAINNGSTVIATSKNRIKNFDDYFRVQKNKVLKL